MFFVARRSREALASLNKAVAFSLSFSFSSRLTRVRILLRWLRLRNLRRSDCRTLFTADLCCGIRFDTSAINEVNAIFQPSINKSLLNIVSSLEICCPDLLTFHKTFYSIPASFKASALFSLHLRTRFNLINLLCF